MADIRIVDIGAGPCVHDLASSRYPIYTRGNAGEVWPYAVFPLSFSLARLKADPVMEMMLETKIVDEDDVADGLSCGGGCFGGYMYLNLSFNRMIATRAPGVSIEESDAVFLGSETVAPPHRPHPDDKKLIGGLHSVRYLINVARTKALPELDQDLALLASKRSNLDSLLQLGDDDLVIEIKYLAEVATELFIRHVEVTSQAGVSLQYLSGVCEQMLGDRSKALDLLSGLGEVTTAEPSRALWTLGRTVANQTELSQEFDAGVAGLYERLEQLAAAETFNREFGRFLEQFGSRGPNEWEPASETWGTKPDLALALIERMRYAEERHAPQARNEALAKARKSSLAEARAKAGPLRRPILNNAIRVASLFSVAREQTKTTVVGWIHIQRLLIRELGRRTAARSGGDDDEIWFCEVGELDDYVANPVGFARAIGERRATRQRLMTRIPPFVFDGELPAFDTWELREAPVEATLLEPGDEIKGLAAVAGVAEGRACIVTDPFEPGDLGPGDVLIAPLTDPAWTPLFIPVEAVVVDVGGQMSHSAIVAREFGSPCVVAATDATKRIPHGSRVRVDGSTGTVTRIL